MDNRNSRQVAEEGKLIERVLLIKRVTKKTAGGNYMTFSALVAVGDGRGRVGVGLGRAQEVPPAIQKAISYAKKHMINVPVYRDSLPQRTQVKYKAAHIILKPAPTGSGLKVGSVARVLLELAGVKDASGKIIRSRNQIANTYAVMEALKKLKARS